MTARRWWAYALGVAGLVLPCGAQPSSGDGGCTAKLSDDRKQVLVEYVRKKYVIPASIVLAMKAESLVKGTCYRQLVFQGTSDVRTWDLTLYVSPDQRFLTSDLLDLSVDPLEENRQKNRGLACALSANRGTSKGRDQAPITIVEFSDFQCPFCKKLAGTIREVAATEGDRVRLVFHHLPLSNHTWARIAAEGAACAQLQGAEGFWSIHDQLFQNQSSITPENIKAELTGYASHAPIDLKAFSDCMGNEMSLGLVLQDLNLAATNNVNATPTVFVNGKRFQGIKDASELRKIIAETEEFAADCSAGETPVNHTNTK